MVCIGIVTVCLVEVRYGLFIIATVCCKIIIGVGTSRIILLCFFEFLEFIFCGGSQSENFIFEVRYFTIFKVDYLIMLHNFELNNFLISQNIITPLFFLSDLPLKLAELHTQTLYLFLELEVFANFDLDLVLHGFDDHLVFRLNNRVSA